MEHIITSVKRNIGMVSIFKVRRNNWVKQQKKIRLTNTTHGGSGLSFPLVAILYQESLLYETINEDTDLDVQL